MLMVDGKKIWIVDVKYYERLLKDIEDSGVCFKISFIPPSVWDKIEDIKNVMKENEEGDIELDAIPPQLLNTLLPFQLDGVIFGVERKGRCMIADEMGLGKTIQGISIAVCYHNDWPLLVIVPSSVKLQWKAEFKKFLPEFAGDIHVIENGKGRYTICVNNR